MKQYYKSLISLLAFLLVLESTVILIGLNRPYWGDETHFVDTIRYFGKEISLNTLQHYNEMATPLSFILYAVWGRIFGFEVQILRILSIVIAVCTFISFHYLLFSLFKEPKIAFFSTIFLALHPYMVGLSLFVFTDMIAILFLVICCIAIKKQSPVLFAFASAFGLLTRQYFVFLTVAAGLYYLIRYQKTKNVYLIKMLFSVLISCLPLLSLFALWKGPSPENSLRDLYLNEGFYFHPHFLTLYVIQFFVYLLPIVLFCWKYIYKNVKVMVTAFIISWLYWWFPVSPSKPAMEVDVYTVGYFHRLVRLVLDVQYEDIVFFLSFILGLPIVIGIMRDCYIRWKFNDLAFLFFVDLSILMFLVIMPFSYLVWEKYFLPVVPLGTIHLLMIRREKMLPTQDKLRRSKNSLRQTGYVCVNRGF